MREAANPYFAPVEIDLGDAGVGEGVLVLELHADGRHHVSVDARPGKDRVRYGCGGGWVGGYDCVAV